MSLIYSFLIIITKIFLKIFFPYEIEGLENLKKLDDKGFLLCANHVSNLDAFFIIVSLNQKVYFLAKVELFRNFIVSYILQKFGAIPVLRGNRNIKAIDEAKKVLVADKILTIFIEGKRSKTGKFLRPRGGAAIIANDTNSMVLPVCITPKNGKYVKIFNKTKITFGSVINKIEFEKSSYKEIRSATVMIMNNIKILRNTKELIK